MKKSKVISVCNQKGGVGKTATTINIGSALARKDKKVLLVDLDPQGDLTVSLGWKDNDSIPLTLSDILTQQMTLKKCAVRDAVLKHDEGIDIIPSDISLSAVEMNLVSTVNREEVLKDCLEELKDEYEYILIDCPPSLSMLTINALACSDSVIIPVQAQYLPAKGMTQLLKTVTGVKRSINPKLTVEGILLTLVDKRTTLAKETAEVIKKNFGKSIKIYDTCIPLSVKVAESSTVGKSILSYDPKNAAAKAYENLSEEVINIGEKRKIRNQPSHIR